MQDGQDAGCRMQDAGWAVPHLRFQTGDCSENFSLLPTFGERRRQRRGWHGRCGGPLVSGGEVPQLPLLEDGGSQLRVVHLNVRQDSVKLVFLVAGVLQVPADVPREFRVHRMPTHVVRGVMFPFG